MSADVSQRTRRPALCGISAPDSLLLTGLFQRRRQPVLRIFDMDYANRPQLALGHHLASLPHQGIAGVVVSHGKEKAGTAHSLGKVESVVKSGGQRFVANNVDAGFEKCLGGSVVQMVWRHDGDGVNALFSLRLRRSHFRKTAVGPLRGRCEGRERRPEHVQDRKTTPPPPTRNDRLDERRYDAQPR